MLRDRRTLPTDSVITAAVMGVVVLVTFGSLQNRGPESTVARYFEAIDASDRTAEGDVIKQSVDNVYSATLRNQVSGVKNVQIIMSRQLPGKAIVEVVVARPGSNGIDLLFTLSKPRIRWKIDTEKTVQDYFHTPF